MIKRTIEISQGPAYLSSRLGQIRIRSRDVSEKDAASIPAEDIGVLVVDQSQVTYTHGTLQLLLEHGGCLVVCGRDHLPAGLLLPFSSNTQQVTRLNQQISATKPCLKRLWKQLVVAKIMAQANNLESDSVQRRKLDVLASEVKSGDPTNIEAQAAKVYWKPWREEFFGFARNKDGTDALNIYLNYGYSVLRAAVARAIVAAGLHPALGIHHHSRANAFCLADDLMEPLRPVIDREARQLMRDGHRELSQLNKARLLSALTARCVIKGRTTEDAKGPLLIQIERMVASLTRCYVGDGTKLVIPTIDESRD